MKKNNDFILSKDFCDKIFDGTHDSPKPCDIGKHKLVTSKNIINGKIDDKDAYYISDEDYEKIQKRSAVCGNDILFSMIGTIGNVCRLTETPDYAIKNMGVFRCENEKDSKWLYYYLQTDIAKKFIEKLMSGSIQKFIALDKLGYIPIMKRTETIDKVVDVIEEIDMQIERNNAMVQKLQVMSNTIYSKTFSTCKDKISFYDYPYLELLKPGITQFDGKKTYIPTAEVNGNNINFNSSKITFENRENRANMQPVYNSVWFAKMKNSNKHIYLTEKDNHLIDNFIFSTGFCGVKCQDFAFEYIVGTVELPYFEEMKDKLAHGATMESVNNDDLKSLLIPNPSKELLEQYHNQTKNIYKQMSLIRIENHKLETLKNNLLPLLINGQLEV